MSDKEVKPKSFRVDDDTAERFRIIAAEIGGNQQETMLKLVEAYEFQKGKMVLTERKADIERFEKYMNILVRTYMEALADNQHITETVRTGYVAQLDAKDERIKELQEKVREKQSEYEVVLSNHDKMTEANAVMSEQLNEIRKELQDREKYFASIIADKEIVNRTLSETLKELKEKNKSMEEEVISAQEIKVQYEKLLSAFESSEQSNKVAKQEIEQLKAKFEEYKIEAQKSIEQAVKEKEFEFDKKIFENEKASQDEIKRIEKDKRKEIDEYQKKYLSLLQKIENSPVSLSQ